MNHITAKHPATALGLYSGGLDSMLAALVLRRAGVAVQVVTFQSPFFAAEAARRSALALELPHHVVELGEDYLAMVQHPPRGHGSQMNPCVDCHAFMLARAGRLMDQLGLDFLFTGEVLGQRPFSQNRGALNAVANDSGYADRLLRPLSAKLLPPTAMERAGLVERQLLQDISGRGRKRQLALAAELGLSDFPSPAGGCLLTEPGFSRRLRDLWAHEPQAGADRIALLKLGRHLRLPAGAKLVVGRNEAENQALERAMPAGALAMHTPEFNGPLALYFGPEHGPDLALAAGLTAGYGQCAPGERAMVALGDGRRLQVAAIDRRKAQEMLL